MPRLEIAVTYSIPVRFRQLADGTWVCHAETLDLIAEGSTKTKARKILTRILAHVVTENGQQRGVRCTLASDG